MTADRGLAGAYNTNVIRYVLQRFDKYHLPVKYITVGGKGRDRLLRMRKPVLFQVIGFARREVSGGYVLMGRNEVGFQVA